MRDIPARTMACVGLVTAVLCSGLVPVLLAYGRGEFDSTYELSAVFPSSSQGVFTDGATDVKLRGIKVGTVRHIELLADGRARLTLTIDAGVEIPVTTEARLEPLSVFGPKFVDLVPGAGEGEGPILGPGDEIASATTGVELTDVLDQAGGLFASVDPVDLVTIFDATSTGVAGLGDTLGAGVDAAAVLVDVAHRRRDLLAVFLPDLHTVTTTIASRSDRFLNRLGDYRTVADAVAGRAGDLDALLDATAAIATRGATLLEDAATEFDLTVRSIAAVLHGIYAERARVPAAFDTIGAFFDMLGAGMRLPGPDGKKLTALKGFITVDLCLVFGVCLLPEGGLGMGATATLAGSSRTGDAPEPDRSGLTDLASLLVDPVGRGS